jgi:hypothetical protein
VFPANNQSSLANLDLGLNKTQQYIQLDTTQLDEISEESSLVANIVQWQNSTIGDYIEYKIRCYLTEGTAHKH